MQCLLHRSFGAQHRAAAAIIFRGRERVGMMSERWHIDNNVYVGRCKRVAIIGRISRIFFNDTC